MSKAVLISIKPKWCEKIASGEKTIEVRKTRPKMNTPFKCYIYCTNGPRNRLVGSQRKVIGEFVCDKIYQYATGGVKGERGVDISAEDMASMSCLTCRQLEEYEYSSVPDEGYGLIGIYGWHISDLVIYDKPKEISEFYRACHGLNESGMCWECDKAIGEEHDCGVNGEIHLIRPPQSWCYVEDALC